MGIAQATAWHRQQAAQGKTGLAPATR
jgi:hypothetical protein